ncbi:MAG: AbrB/MazE/SpoVT family DNA-binding domain-containing protein [Thermococcus sp.]|nr:AbrB/MazE/SpoVT family DNA-binding domain-containing protein [Thermococcus sp.]
MVVVEGKKYIKKTVSLGSSKYQSVGIVIPKKLAKAAGIGKGDLVAIWLEDGKIMMQKVEVSVSSD